MVNIYNAWYHFSDKLEIGIVNKTGIKYIDCNMNPYCYVLQNNLLSSCLKGNLGIERTDLKTLEGERVAKVFFNHPFEVKLFRDKAVNKNIRVFEADIPFIRRWMIDKDIRVETDYSKLYYDIETDDDGVIECIGCIDNNNKENWFNGNEKDIVHNFCDFTKNYQMILGWNNKYFDRPILDDILKEMRREGELRNIIELDVLEMYKQIMTAPSYKLDYVGKKELNEGKIELDEDYTEEDLKKYNIKDVDLTKRIDEKHGLSDLRIEIANFCHTFPNETSPMISIDSLLLEQAKKLGMVLPSCIRGRKREKFKGAYIKEPEVGVFDNVAVFDFEGLYPNIIINEKLSPDIDRKLFPEMLKNVIELERKFKIDWKENKNIASKNKREALKILRNATYGVLANPHFRLFDAKVSSKVAEIGREKLKEVEKRMTDLKYKVVYGDTDSIFIQVDCLGRGVKIEQYLNKKLFPYVLKFEKFFKPVIFTGRIGGEKGTKKRYAGYDVREGLKQFVVVGLEIKRSDSCELMRRVQEDVIKLILNYKENKNIQEYLDKTKKKLLDGDLDELLVFSKGVKDNINDYKVEQPQVRVMKKMLEKGIVPDGKVHFVVTATGEEPVIDDELPKFIDRKWYWEERIKPMIDRLMTVFDKKVQEKLVI